MACQEDWPAARDLLRHGYFETFLSSMGRADLADAAGAAAHVPDLDRGLDQLLTRLPSGVLEGPRLGVNPREVHLGELHIGDSRTFDLHLENQGMRLLYGSVSSEECTWLALGDGEGDVEKHFQFGSEAVIPVHVQGQRLRASIKPLEGRLLVDSNGGTVAVLIRADVPAKPFPSGVLAGALTPRQLAEKAKKAPKEAAELFENGAVAQWYRDNGWIYPISGPTLRGPAVVQQFFEVLGLTTPPKVELSEKSVTLRGDAGESVEHLLHVHNADAKPKLVFARGTSSQPWLEVGRAKLNGQSASIPIVVPSIPDSPGERLTARVAVIANGNQRFVVPVTLEVSGYSLRFDESLPVQKPPASPIKAVGNRKFVSEILPAMERVATAFRLGWPIAVLIALLIGVLCWDVFHRETPDTGLLDYEPRLEARFNDTMRFGIVMLKEPDESGKFKRLTYSDSGETNNTCLKIDDKEILFGRSPGRWVRDRKGDLRKIDLKNRGYRSEWEVSPDPEQFPNSRIVVTQTVRLVAGEQTRVLDTYLIHYSVWNHAKEGHKVGLRVMLDTFIGANDGSPFVIPGQPGLLQTMRRFPYKEIPDYVQALEHEDLTNPGTVAHLGLKGLRVPDSEVTVESPDSMLICRWPGNPEIKWDWEPEPINQDPNRKDSCVALYWSVLTMNPGERREMAFTYGLNTVSTSSTGELGLTLGGSFKPDGEFTLTAYVHKPSENQIVRLVLPQGLLLSDGESAEKVVASGGDYSQVSWRVRAEHVGTFTLTVVSGLSRESRSVRITDKGIFD